MTDKTAYQAALDYLYSFVDYSLTRAFRNAPENFDLGRMVQLMEHLGNPHMAYPVIHIAGTKGKGSVSALCASALTAAGYRTGLYTSPHLDDYAERICLDGEAIPHTDLIALIEELKPHVAAIPKLTTFEITTAIGFLYFARQKVDVAVVEVGLGGRLDATNVVTPLLSVITSISFDHMTVLGNTLEAIAGEKAGIIKPGRPVVVAPQKPAALKTIEAIATERGSSLTKVGFDIRYAAQQHTLDGQGIFVWNASDQTRMDAFVDEGESGGWQPLHLEIPLLGYHQAENTATAYAALKVAAQYGLTVDDDAIRQGFKSVKWSGRFELLKREPPVVIDSAHNDDSALKLRLALDDYFPGRPVVMVFGASEDKDIDSMFSVLLPRIKSVIATQSIHPRAMPAEHLVEAAHRFGVPAKTVLPLEDALCEALSQAKDEALVLVTGSLFVAAGAKAFWLTEHPCQAGVQGQ